MSHIFNTGSRDPMRTLVTRGIVDLLRPLHREEGGYLGKIATWGGLVRTYTSEVDLEWIVKHLTPSPGIAVTTATRQFQSINTQRTHVQSDMDVTLYFLSQHARDLNSRMEGDASSKADRRADPGLHTIMEHALELMHGAYPSAMSDVIKQIQISSEEELATLPELTIWFQTYSVRTFNVDFYVPGSRGQSAQFRTPRQLLESIGWRVTGDPDETPLPDPPVGAPTLDHVQNLT